MIPFAIFATVAEALLLLGRGAPAQHRWLAVVLVLAVLWVAARRGMDPVRRAAWLGMLGGAAVVNRASVRFDSDLPTLLRILDLSGTLAAALAFVLAGLTLSRLIGRREALLAGLSGVMMLGCLGLVLERSPGARLGINATTVYKGPWPHWTFGQWYPPHSRVRSYHASNPRNYYDPPAPLPRQWRLNVHSARDEAELRFPSDSVPILRVEIGRAEGGNTWGIQLNQGPIVVRHATRYELRFTARADRARQISAGIAQWHPPWENLGYYRTVDLTPSWTRWTDTLTVKSDDPNARIHFDLGHDSASVELADMVLTDLTTQQRVLPDTLPYSLTYRFNDVGCRGSDVLPRSPADGTRRVLILGDSYAMGLGVRDPDVFGARLERLLADSAPPAGAGSRRYQVITCAVPGWGARQERQFYQHLRGRYKPELVIVMTTWNDGRLQHDEVALPGGSPTGAGTDGLATELLRLADRVRSDSARLGVIVFRNTPAALWQPVLDAVATLPASGVPVLDLWPALSAHGAWEELVADRLRGSLPNEIAHRIAATAVAGFLRSHGLLE